MPAKKSFLTVKDQFCGAGGSSQGVRNLSERMKEKLGTGLELRWALNHWGLAIETHNTNFPDTKHDCADISAVDPRRYESTDILITSPECTKHSPGSGQKRKWQKQLELYGRVEIKAEDERSRATMWDVPRFAEFHNYNLIVVENVVEAREWIMWDAWLMAMHKLDYKHECVYWNSMHSYPTPQSRDRMYVIFWKKGNPAPNLKFTPLAWCHKCTSNVDSVQTWKRTDRKYGKYKKQYVYCCPTCTVIVEPYYYAAFNCIDWSQPGKRIGDRKKALALNTQRRIQHGIDTFWGHGKQFAGTPPMIINLSHTHAGDRRASSIEDFLRTQTGRNNNALLNPFLMQLDHSKANMQPRDIMEALSTQTTTQAVGIVRPPLMVENRGPATCRNSTDALATLTTCNNLGLLTSPFLIDMNSSGSARPILETLATITAGGVKNGIITGEQLNSFFSYYYSTGYQESHITEALDTLRTKAGQGLVTMPAGKPEMDDCFYRMLTAMEVKLGMAFDRDYQVLGTQEHQVKQCGNAVTPPVMDMLIERGIQTFN